MRRNLRPRYVVVADWTVMRLMAGALVILFGMVSVSNAAYAAASGKTTGASGMKATKKKTTVTDFVATPGTVTKSDDLVTLSASVSDATSCTFSSDKTVVGLPATVACANGTVAKSVTLPLNSGTKPLEYVFDLSVTGTKTVKAKAVKVTVEPGAGGITVPSAPTDVLALPGNEQATVSWMAPLNDGGSAITNYTVTSSPGTKTCSTTTTSCTVDGLVNGDSYTFTVVAGNADGNGPASSPSNSVIPGQSSAPGAPSGVLTTAGNEAVAVFWTVPAAGSSSITKFVLVPSIGGSPQPAITVPVSSSVSGTTGTQDEYTVGGLTNGTAYGFSISATNSSGSGPSTSAPVSATPEPGGSFTMDPPSLAAPGVPPSPTGITIPPGWTANIPASNALAGPISGEAAVLCYGPNSGSTTDPCPSNTSLVLEYSGDQIYLDQDGEVDVVPGLPAGEVTGDWLSLVQKAGATMCGLDAYANWPTEIGDPNVFASLSSANHLADIQSAEFCSPVGGSEWFGALQVEATESCIKDAGGLENLSEYDPWDLYVASDEAFAATDELTFALLLEILDTTESATYPTACFIP